MRRCAARAPSASQRPAKIVTGRSSWSGAVEYQSHQLAVQPDTCPARQPPNRGGKASLPAGAASSIRDGARVALGSSAPLRDAPRRYFSGTIAVTSISTIIPGQASWLIVSSVCAGSGWFPNASTWH
jgi:hypothetical protein